ncbi:MAG: ABC transporter permease [Deltaproteobacteria bacterium]|jgi:cell division transport system permease protein|nr:ABC transporter permease [Deltaproteobacteria bacterium]
MALSPGYFTRRALRNIRHSPVLSLAAVCTVALSLALLAFFAIAVLNVQALTANWNENLSIVAYLDKVPDEKVLRQLEKRIEAFPEVGEVTFVDQKVALERFRQRLGENAELLDGLGTEVLPASFEIQLHPESRTSQSILKVVSRLQNDSHFNDLHYGQEWLEKFEAFLFLLRASGAVLGGFLVFAALVIVANTIKLTLYARHDELEAMAMVGGTSLFIKLPYLIEGVVQGLLGGTFALLLSYLTFRFLLYESLLNLLLVTGVDQIHFLPLSGQIFLVLSGGGIGLLGSLFALRKFVRIGPQ